MHNVGFDTMAGSGEDVSGRRYKVRSGVILLGKEV
jgi:hypothetical protein